MKLKIWRGIFLSSIENLDLKNFGCHWSKNEHFCYGTEFFNENISDFERTGEKMFLFETEVNEGQIDIYSTEKSNFEFPNEEECVLKRNIQLKKIILINQKKKLEFKNINTGNRVCKWISTKTYK